MYLSYVQRASPNSKWLLSNPLPKSRVCIYPLTWRCYLKEVPWGFFRIRGGYSQHGISQPHMGCGRTVDSGLGTGALPFETHNRWCLDISVTYLYPVRNGHILAFQIRKTHLQRIPTPPSNRLAGIPGPVSHHINAFVVHLWGQSLNI